MPYYIFKMTSPPGMDLVKNLELLDEFTSFKEAKACARDLRKQLDGSESNAIKVMFADNQLLAEEQLLEFRDKPILMEHEK